jgi:two-component system sensor histidine kinase YesM
MYEKFFSLIIRLKQKYLNLDIGKKITLYFFGLLFLSLLTSAFIDQTLYNDMNSKKAIQVSQRTLDSINLSIDSLISSVDLSTQPLLYNKDVQEELDKTDSTNYYDNIGNENFAINYRLNEVMRQNLNITSIYIYTLNNFQYSLYNDEIKYLNVKDIKNTQLYKEAFTKGIPYIVKLNADGVFDSLNETRKKQYDNFISIVRGVNSYDTFKPLALSIVNIQVSYLQSSISSVSDEYGMDVFVMDNKNREIIDFKKKYNFDFNRLRNTSHGKGYFSAIININKKSYIYSSININKYNWTIIGLTPIEAVSKDSSNLYVIDLIILTLNSALFFFGGSLIVSKMITKPIKKLVKSMNNSKRGDFKTVKMNTYNDEIGELKDGYNKMISKIQLLINDIVEEQNMKRKYELNVLYEQIKPHFLYNTFDAISSLALSAGNDELYSIICALGAFYKNSLSKGSEIITISQEIDIIKNYLFILSYRNKELFSVYYDVDDDVTNYKTLKLVLQPLVENAIYKGIRPKGEKGNIMISVFQSEGYIYMEVEDDGIGIDEKFLKDIIKKDNFKSKNSFGLVGTLERLRLYYSNEDVLSIKSKVGQGTKVIIKIPVVKE